MNRTQRSSGFTASPVASLLASLLASFLGACSSPPAESDPNVMDAGTSADAGAGTAQLAIDLKANGTAVSNAKLIAAGWAYSVEGAAVSNIVRVRFDAMGSTFEAEIATPKSAAPNQPCAVRIGGGGAQLASTRSGGSCTSTSTAAVELGNEGLTFSINAALVSYAPATPPPASIAVKLTELPPKGTGTNPATTLALTGGITVPQSALSRLSATVSGEARSYTALEYTQDIGGGATRPSVLGIRPMIDGRGLFTGYDFLQVLFVNGSIGTGGSCESGGPTLIYKGVTDANQMTQTSTLEDSAADSTDNCSVTASATATELFGSFAGSVKKTNTTFLSNGTYRILR